MSTPTEEDLKRLFDFVFDLPDDSKKGHDAFEPLGERYNAPTQLIFEAIHHFTHQALGDIGKYLVYLQQKAENEGPESVTEINLADKFETIFMAYLSKMFYGGCEYARRWTLPEMISVFETSVEDMIGDSTSD